VINFILPIHHLQIQVIPPAKLPQSHPQLIAQRHVDNHPRALPQPFGIGLLPPHGYHPVPQLVDQSSPVYAILLGKFLEAIVYSAFKLYVFSRLSVAEVEIGSNVDLLLDEDLPASTLLTTAALLSLFLYVDRATVMFHTNNISPL